MASAAGAPPLLEAEAHDAPERLDRFMARANAAYYATRDPFADFATAPQMTPVFGEILGAWARIVAAQFSSPPILAEAGPGTGALMASALRAYGDAAVHLIETSPALRRRQRQRLPAAIFHDGIDNVPPGPLILLANEFLDALPIRQFIRRNTGWHERFCVGGAFVEQPADVALPDDPIGSVRETREAAENFVRALCRRGAVALFIDYGPMTSAPGDSFQAIAAGAYADPLANPGAADLTAHVDFAALKAVAEDEHAAADGPVKQNAFLTSLGFMQRTDILAQRNPDAAPALKAAAQRLTQPEAMGSLFKVLAIRPAHFPSLPGFDA